MNPARHSATHHYEVYAACIVVEHALFAPQQISLLVVVPVLGDSGGSLSAQACSLCQHEANTIHTLAVGICNPQGRPIWQPWCLQNARQNPAKQVLPATNC
jgi:hypothetical protein